MSGVRRQRALPIGPRRASAHATVWVEADRERPSGRTLYVDGFSSSYVDLEDPGYLRYAYVRHLAALLDGLPSTAPSVLHLGGGGCTLARWFAAVRPASRNLVYERDEVVVRLAREQLGLRSSAAVRVKVGDGRDGVARHREASLDAVVLDAFDGPRVPAHLTTRQFLDDVRRVLRPGAPLLVNVSDDPPLPVTRALAAGLLEAFADVALVTERTVASRRAAGNVVLAGATGRLDLGPLRALVAADGPRTRILGRAQVVGFAGGAGVPTDP